MNGTLIADLGKEGLTKAVSGLKSIAHRGRLQILCFLLQDGERTVSDIVEATGLSQSAVSQHLARMKAAGVLSDRRDGHQVYYGVSGAHYANLVSALCTIYGTKSNRSNRSK
ncbi:MAG: winged helix-turn-helix transcriptional regulator [Spirochaetia bacterium]|nr:winged helix-turn-helix transcriptional regulator [Spirochaetia bacterium]